MILDLILKALYLMLPAYAANMAPVLARGHLKSLARPVDGGIRFRKKPLFGRHKTWRGVVTGVASAVAVSYVQSLFQDARIFLGWTVLDYTGWLAIGMLLGAGAIIGDILESMFKRQLSIKEGKPFIPFDQLDFAAGAVLLLMFYYSLSISMVATIFIVSFILHIVINHLAFYLKIRDERW